MTIPLLVTLRVTIGYRYLPCAVRLDDAPLSALGDAYADRVPAFRARLDKVGVTR